ncbi:MAG TPA: hypothetical protein VNH11_07035 [Pirellulales bacterium]|nr:hypothetical protein [Pirellulales bacterium]
MTRILHGVVRGRTIELDEDAGLQEGRKVEVILRAKGLPGPPPGWRPGSRETAAGMMAPFWTEEDDLIFEEIYRDRKKESRNRAVE